MNLSRLCFLVCSLLLPLAFLTTAARAQQRSYEELCGRESRYPYYDSLRTGGDFQSLAQRSATYSRHDEAAQLHAKANPGLNAGITTLCDSFLSRFVPALATLDSLAKNADVFLLNEAHHLSVHRYLGLSLLKPLYASGYRYLAVEALSPWDTLLQERGYPLEGKTGVYTDDPVMGLLLVKAMRMGWRLVAYERVFATTTEGREEEQAENLYQKIFAKDSAAQAFIFCGYGHGQKISSSLKMMGERLIGKLDSGKRVVSVDQVQFNSKQGLEDKSCEYRRFLATNPQAPALALDDSGRVWMNAFHFRRYDAQVFHPPYVNRRGRPVWLFDLYEGSRQHDIPAFRIDGGRLPLLARVNLIETGFCSVPFDQIVIDDPQADNWLFLPDAPCEITLLDAQGLVVGRWAAPDADTER